MYIANRLQASIHWKCKETIFTLKVRKRSILKLKVFLFFICLVVFTTVPHNEMLFWIHSIMIQAYERVSINYTILEAKAILFSCLFTPGILDQSYWKHQVDFFT
jgi:chloramphenicol O-acetyltransferase